MGRSDHPSAGNSSAEDEDLDFLDVPVMRVPISLPCQARVRPGTPSTEGTLAERTEWCAVDAWWMVGVGMLCDRHLREVFGPAYDAVRASFPGLSLRESELRPWAEQPRYEQWMAAGPAPGGA